MALFKQMNFSVGRWRRVSSVDAYQEAHTQASATLRNHSGVLRSLLPETWAKLRDYTEPEVSGSLEDQTEKTGTG